MTSGIQLLTRGRAIALVASTIALARCSSNSNAIRVGSKNFTESLVIAEIYAQALEAAGMTVERLFNLGSTQIVMAALQRGDVDLYPEYTGTALVDVLHEAPLRDPAQTYRVVGEAYKQRYDLVWLQPSPMNDSQALATTAALAANYAMHDLSAVARLAPQLRLATIPEFTSRPDGLPGLQKFYGGFKFADVRTYDIALKYDALLSGKADVATAFTTDGALASPRLVVLADDRHFWPPYHVAPVVRAGALAKNAGIAKTLDAVSPHITTEAAQRMNAAVEGGQSPADAASAFLKAARA